jgi:hypothetical protein
MTRIDRMQTIPDRRNRADYANRFHFCASIAETKLLLGEKEPVFIGFIALGTGNEGDEKDEAGNGS